MAHISFVVLTKSKLPHLVQHDTNVVGRGTAEEARDLSSGAVEGEDGLNRRSLSTIKTPTQL